MASQSEQKIDISASVRSAYTVVIKNTRLAVDLAWLPFVLLAGAKILAWLSGDAGRFGRILALLIHTAGFPVFGMAFIVRWHRFILLGETATDQFFPPGWGAFLLTWVKLGLLLSLGTVVLVVIAAIASHFLTGVPHFLTGVMIVGVIALALAWARVSLAFPAAAIQQPISLVGEAWDLVAGNYWRLLACLIICCAPFGITGYVVDEIGGALPSGLWIAFKVIELAVWFVGSAVLASLLSDVYRRLYPNSARRMG